MIVFVVGCPRSGTTLLLDVLRMHPDVVHVTQRSLGMTPDDTGTRETDVFGRIKDDDDVRRRFQALARANVGKVLVEKTPFHTLQVERIRRVFPAARILAMLRDPRDNALSILAAVKRFGWNWAPKTFDNALRFWLRYLSGTRAADIVLRYEDAVADRCAFVVAAHHAARLQPLPPADVDAIVAATADGKNVSDMRDGVYRKGIAGEWRTACTPEQIDAAWRLVGPQMVQLGYPME
jgi:hypothetical protein